MNRPANPLSFTRPLSRRGLLLIGAGAPLLAAVQRGALAQDAASADALVKGLAQVGVGDLPVLPLEGRREFLAFAAPSRPGAVALRELIRLGGPAIPVLVAHLRDETATRAVLRGVPEQPLLVAAGRDAALDGGLAPLRLSGANAADSEEEKEDPAETMPPAEAPMPATRETYTLTVGDLCFMALGQILNRRWEPVRSSPKGLLLMGPGAVNGVAAAAAREARALTASLLWQRLKDDLDAGDGPLRAGAYERLALYYPETLESLMLPQLRRSTWDTSVIDTWLQTVLYREPSAAAWPLLLQKFSNRLRKDEREGILHRLLEHQAVNVRRRDAAAFRRQRLLLGTLYPGARTDTWPRFTGVPRRTQATLVAAMTRDESKELDEAIRQLFRDLRGKSEDDDRFALAIAPRMLGRGMERDLQSYYRKRVEKTTPELRAEMERLLAKSR